MSASGNYTRENRETSPAPRGAPAAGPAREPSSTIRAGMSHRLAFLAKRLHEFWQSARASCIYFKHLHRFRSRKVDSHTPRQFRLGKYPDVPVVDHGMELKGAFGH